MPESPSPLQGRNTVRKVQVFVFMNMETTLSPIN